MLYTQDSLVYFDLVFHISTGLPIIKVSKMKQIARFPIGLFFFFLLDFLFQYILLYYSGDTIVMLFKSNCVSSLNS